MKVSDIISDLLVNSIPDKVALPGRVTFNEDTIRGKELILLKEKLMECDEFKDCDFLEFIPMPIIQNKEGKPITAETVILGEGKEIIMEDELNKFLKENGEPNGNKEKGNS